MKLQDLYKKKTLADYIIYASVLLGGILIDQLTKWLTVRYMDVFEHIPVIKIGDFNIASLLHIKNYGAALGMLSNNAWIFKTISTVAILAMLAYLFLGHAETKLSGIGLSMMISGGIGNMIDRIAIGYVVDMIYLDMFDFLGINTIFNTADTFVCIGAGILVLALTLELIEEAKKEKAAKEAAKTATEEKTESIEETSGATASVETTESSEEEKSDASEEDAE